MIHKAIFLLLLGGTIGISLRLLLLSYKDIKLGITIDNTSLINIISSFFVGILSALELDNFNIYLLINIGFLGCFTTFSTLIFKMFSLINKRQYKKFIFFYTEIIIYSILVFSIGYFSTSLIL